MLLVTCTIVPYQLAFQNDPELNYGWMTVDIIINFSFLIDIFVNFFAAYYDSEMVLIDRRKVTQSFLIFSIGHCQELSILMVHH